MSELKDQKPIEDKVISAEHIDNKAPSVHDNELEKDGIVREMDKFGAWAKSDEREIRLVKKLDRYIMVSLIQSLVIGAID